MVNKSMIHYCFRSKEKLYSKFIASVFDYLLSTDLTYFEKLEENKNILWILTTEQYNNKVLFEKTFTNLYPNEIEFRKNHLKKGIEIASISHLNKFELKKQIRNKKKWIFDYNLYVIIQNMKFIFLIAAFNAFFFSILLFQKKNRTLYDNILIIWLLYLGLFIGIYSFYSHDLFTHFHLLSSSLISLFLLQGGFLYIYVSVLVRYQTIIKRKYFNYVCRNRKWTC